MKGSLIILFICSLFLSCQKKEKYGFPFDEITKIIVYSYPARNPFPPPPPFGVDDKDYHPETKIVKDGKVLLKTSDIIEKVTLKDNQINEIIKFLKTDYCGENALNAACYAPRHLIAFYNKENKVFAYFEICLECGNAEASENLFKYSDFCIEKASIAQKLLTSFGIKYFGQQIKQSL